MPLFEEEQELLIDDDNTAKNKNKNNKQDMVNSKTATSFQGSFGQKVM